MVVVEAGAYAKTVEMDTLVTVAGLWRGMSPAMTGPARQTMEAILENMATFGVYVSATQS